MVSLEVGDLLEDCLRAARLSTHSTEAERLDFCLCRDSLCAELASLLQDSMEMKWPFVPEKWQYKQSVSADDKTNLSDLTSTHLTQLLAVLKASIVAQEAGTALSVVFLVDRFLYWTDESSRLLKITKLLHKHHPDTPVAPQLVIRQARVYLNSGKLRKAEYILSSLINNSGSTGCWVYHSESDRALVQAVSVQVRGMILRTLGLWLEAAELIWASLVGYYALPQPDKKGIGASLCTLANILVSMNEQDFNAFRTSPDIDLLSLTHYVFLYCWLCITLSDCLEQSLLGDRSHRLLSAAQAAKMAVVYSQYTSLYVLTNVATQGTCLLSYSFSVDCPAAQRQSFLLQAREAFSIGLLTKAEGELVTSKQELHTFLKAAYSLTVTHKWLGTPSSVVAKATEACQKALAHFYDYSVAETQHKDSLCGEIMQLVAQVKRLLRVDPFINSEKGSFVPDSYRNIEDTSVDFTLEGFAEVMRKFQKYHASLCDTTNANCKGAKEGVTLCITALGTTIGTECGTEACKVPPEGEEPQQGGARSSDGPPPQTSHMCTNLGSTDNLGSTENKKRDVSCKIPATSSSNASSDSEKFELIRAGIETLVTEEDWMSDGGVMLQPSVAEGEVHSLSQLAIETTSSSLSDSFGSQSSWEKIPVDLISPTTGKPQPSSLSKRGTGQSSKSPGSDGSFFHLETLDTESNDSARDPTPKRPVESRNVDPKMETEVDSTANPHSDLSQFVPAQCETSTESSFEMLGDPPSGHQSSTDSPGLPQVKNPLCFSCLRNSPVAAGVPQSQYVLSQEDYRALLAGVCHACLLKRLHSDETQFKLKTHRSAHNALHLKFSKATGMWTARETCVYIGEPMGIQGKQRTAIWVQFLHQEERLSSYVGKDYLKPKEIQFHLKDVERQMTAQYYVTEFNKSLYDKEVMAQIFFIPSEALLILNGDEIAGCVTVEPFMLGDFVKLTNNTGKKDKSFQATEYGLAFGHFTYLFSDCQEVVVDLQGWVTANGKGLTYLTDPQIHSTKTPKGPSNFADRGLRYFLEEQHGPECNGICQLLKLPRVLRQPHVLPQNL